MLLLKASPFGRPYFPNLEKGTPLDETLFTKNKSAQLYAPLSLRFSGDVTSRAIDQKRHVKSIRGFCAQLRVGTRQAPS